MAKKHGINERLQWIIRDLLDRKILTNKQFAEVIGCDVKTVWKYLNSNAIHDTNFLEKMSDVYGVNKRWVLTNEGKPYFARDEIARESLNEPDRVDPGSTIAVEEEIATPGKKVYFQSTERILKSENRYAETLNKLIKSHRKDSKSGGFADKLKREIVRTEDRIKALEKEMIKEKVGKKK